MNLFELATRKKFRYIFKGVITTEDLWDLSVQDLNTIFKALKAEERQAEEESLLAEPTPEDEIRKDKIEIIRRIADIKLEDAHNATRQKEMAEQRERLMSIIAEKQDQDLRNKSQEELRKMLDQM